MLVRPRLVGVAGGAAATEERLKASQRTGRRDKATDDMVQKIRRAYHAEDIWELGTAVEESSFRGEETSLMNSGDAAAATWKFRGDTMRRRGDSVETFRGDAAAATWKFRGHESRRRRGLADSP